MSGGTGEAVEGPQRVFWRLADADFVLLTTYRRNGLGVATVVWVAADGDHLVVTTPKHSAKVKRVRRDTRVALTPCGRLGRVADGAPVVHTDARVLGPDDEHPSATTALRAKYRWQYDLVLRLEALARRRRGKDPGRLIIALAPPSTG